MSSSWLIRASRRAPFFLLIAAWLGLGVAAAAEDVRTEPSGGSDVVRVREALVEAVEASGLVVTAVIPFNDMLARTAGDLGYRASPFANAQVVQFCSARIAWQLIEEERSQLALCPLSIVVYATVDEPRRVMLSFRLPGTHTPGRQAATDLLRRLIVRTQELAQVGW